MSLGCWLHARRGFCPGVKQCFAPGYLPPWISGDPIGKVHCYESWRTVLSTDIESCIGGHKSSRSCWCLPLSWTHINVWCGIHGSAMVRSVSLGNRLRRDRYHGHPDTSFQPYFVEMALTSPCFNCSVRQWLEKVSVWKMDLSWGTCEMATMFSRLYRTWIFLLWDYLKSFVYNNRPRRPAVLQDNIHPARSIYPTTLRRMRSSLRCRVWAVSGRQFELIAMNVQTFVVLHTNVRFCGSASSLQRWSHRSVFLFLSRTVECLMDLNIYRRH